MSAGLYSTSARNDKRHYYGCERDPIGARDNKRAFVIEAPPGYTSSPKHTAKTLTPTTARIPVQTLTVMPVQLPTPAAQSPTARLGPTPADDEADPDARPPRRSFQQPSRHPSPQLPRCLSPCLSPQLPRRLSQSFPWLPLSVDLSQFVARVHDQTKHSSCAANAVCAAYGIHLKRGKNNFDPSYMFLWYNARKLKRDERTGRLRGSEHRNEGASISLTYEAFHKEGVCEECLWPRNQGLNMRPDPPVYAAAMVNSIGEEQYIEKGDDFIQNIEHCLFMRNPVVFNFEVHESFRRVEEWVDFVMPTPDVQIPGAVHAVVAVGYDHSTERVKILNSWGTGGWGGDNGYFYMSYDIIESDICWDFWVAPLPTHYPA